MFSYASSTVTQQRGQPGERETTVNEKKKQNKKQRTERKNIEKFITANVVIMIMFMSKVC